MNISRLGLGTAELGLDYGINSKKPTEKQSIELLDKALNAGIKLFDTAPSYGNSEALLGKAFGTKKDCIIATKVNIPPANIEKFVLKSLKQSKQRLQREYLDIVQVHNATLFTNPDIFKVLTQEKESGMIHAIGASVYEPENALAVIDSGMIDILQIAYNLLDQRMEDVIEKAKSVGITILSRSVYLKGVLTEKAKYLPAHCAPLREAVEDIKRKRVMSGNELTNFALRFVLSNPYIDSTLIGINNEAELNFALNAFNKEKMCNSEPDFAYSCRMNDKYWLNPSNWRIDR